MSELTEQEKKLLDIIRDKTVRHGKIHLILFYQDNKLVRAEFEERTESVKLN